MPQPINTESFVTCSNSQGTPVRGTLMHLSGQNVVFEVYNPFSLLQLSEVLHSFSIHIGERTVYNGRSVVRSLLNTGIMLVAEVTLVDAWQDVDILSIFRDKSKLGKEIKRFLSEWQKQKEIRPEFKVFTTNFHSFLSELSLWMKQIEVAIDHREGEEAEVLRSELVEEVTGPIRPELQEFLGNLNQIVKNKVDPEQAPLHKMYLRKKLHPLLLCSPFVHRSYTKPLGYAGDYGMINMILENPFKGNTVFAKAINSLVLELEPAEAHRNRIKILNRLLEEEANRVLRTNGPFKVLNIACGPAKEIRTFIDTFGRCDECEITLLDFSSEALSYCEKESNQLIQRSDSKIRLKFIEKSIDILLRQATGKSSDGDLISEKFDFVYCAGLFDYLIDPVCERLISLFYDWLLPGGLMSVTNIHPSNPGRNFMEYFLEWNVFHRDEKHLEKLDLSDGVKTVIGDETGVNIFLNTRKAATAK